MNLVVDANVVVRWHVQGPGSDHADSLFDRNELFVAPDIVLPEVANAFRTLCHADKLDWEEAAVVLEGVAAPFSHLVPSIEIIDRAFEIAHELDHPAYDCFYLAVCEEEEAPLVTGDERLARKLRGTPWEERTELIRMS